jgi:hypothetical protein
MKKLKLGRWEIVEKKSSLVYQLYFTVDSEKVHNNCYEQTT